MKNLSAVFVLVVMVFSASLHAGVVSSGPIIPKDLATAWEKRGEELRCQSPDGIRTMVTYEQATADSLQVVRLWTKNGQLVSYLDSKSFYVRSAENYSRLFIKDPQGPWLMYNLQVNEESRESAGDLLEFFGMTNFEFHKCALPERYK